ncbi:hypothetical protein L218DRAFT_885109, partial [Marasmius fiardii PR-910]
SSVNESTGFTPFELNYGYILSMLFDVRQDETALPGIRAYGIQAMQNLFDAHDGIIESRVFQTHEANKQRTKEPELKVGIKVYLSTKNLKLSKGRAFFYPLPTPSIDIYTVPGHWDMAQICEYRRYQAVIHCWKDPKVSRVNVDPAWLPIITLSPDQLLPSLVYLTCPLTTVPVLIVVPFRVHPVIEGGTQTRRFL